MPAEAERLTRRVGTRDRWFLGLALCAAVAATPGALLLGSHGSGAAPGGACVSTIRTSFTGGATYTYCGADAVAACGRPAQAGGDLASECRKLGLAPPG